MRRLEKREIWPDKRCRRVKELRDVLWRRYRRHNSQPALEWYKRGRNENSKIRKELFHNSIRRKLSLKMQLMRLRNSGGRVVDDNNICHQLNDKLPSVITVQNTIAPTPETWDGQEDLESIETEKT